MIKQFSGASDSYGQRFEPVPEGSYVASIKSVKVARNERWDVLELAVDITEGALAGYYSKRFAAESAANTEGVKYKGVYRLNIPNGDGTDADGWAVSRFNKMLGAVTASNAGFKWNWNEQSLIGKAVGLVYRVREWEFKGSTGLTTEIGMLCSVADAREGRIKLKPRLLQRTETTAATVDTGSTAGFTATTEELPF